MKASARNLRVLTALLVFAVASVLTARSDQLIYSDGFVMEGKHVGTTDDVIIFQSPRFGEIRVSTSLATVKASPSPIASPVTAPSPGENSTTTIVGAVPEKKQSALARLWASWTGRFQVSLELTDNQNDESNWLLEFLLKRQWTNDEVRLEPRYEFKSTVNDGSTTDLFKLKGYWRHDFPHRLFSLYNPYYERNQEYTYQNLPLDYELNRQSAGGGVRLIEKAGNVLRVGLLENYYRVNLLNYPVSLDLWAESLFIEAELLFPGGWSLHETGQWYYYGGDNDQGWTNEIELNKTLGGGITLGLRHEYRNNPPELSGDNYSKLRLLLGYAF